MAILNLTISNITLNVNGLHNLIETGITGQPRLHRETLSKKKSGVRMVKTRPSYTVYKNCNSR